MKIGIVSVTSQPCWGGTNSTVVRQSRRKTF